MKINCDVYRCARKEKAYLYLKSGMQTEDLPEDLLALLGELTQFLTLELNESRKLAQANVRDVLASLDESGFFLQMPPGEENARSTPATEYLQ